MLEEMDFQNLKSFSYGWRDLKYDESLLTQKKLNLKKDSHEIVFIDERYF